MTRSDPGSLLAAELVRLGADAGRITLNGEQKQELCVNVTGRRTMSSSDRAATELEALWQGRRGLASGQCRSAEDAAALALAAFRSAGEKQPEDAPALADCADCSFRRAEKEPDPALLARRAEELLAGTAERHPQIRFITMRLSHVRKTLRILDLKGHEALDERAFFMLDTSLCAVGETRSSSYTGLTLLLEQLNRPLLEHPDVRRTLELAERQLGAVTREKPAPAVVLAPDVLSMLFYQLTDRLLSDGAFRSKTGSWQGKLGERVADERLTLRLAGRQSGMLDAPQITSAGQIAREQTLLSGGVLTGTLLSDRAAAAVGAPACSTESRCFAAEGGWMTLEELCRAAGSGILVTRISGGIPNLSGEISGVAKSSFLIENGAVTRPVEGVSLTGNLLDVLADIDGLSSETSRNGLSSLPYLFTRKLRIS